MVITAAVALFLGFITLRMKGHYLPLATIAWGMSLFYVFGNLEMLGGHTGMSGIPALSFAGFELKSENRYYYLIWAITLGLLWATNNLLDSRTGRAIRALKGRLEMAHGGTLFLDEIGNIGLQTQMDLLRVLETKSFTRLGGTEVVNADFRVKVVELVRYDSPAEADNQCAFGGISKEEWKKRIVVIVVVESREDAILIGNRLETYRIVVHKVAERSFVKDLDILIG